ncbi:hypothetical protein [Pseudomonas sp. CGJS7]|uniref:hypothetical protein n=1 Tax=Pseudomonas sp. CGJS7 TaxID=3109348 RepID=UPI0030085086
MDKFMRLAEEFRDESDRGCAVLAVCVLEEMLATIVVKAVSGAKLARQNLAPPGRLSLAIENAEMLGLIGADEAKSFKALVKIRNEFAHGVKEGLTFQTERIALLCRDLPLPVPEAVKTEVVDIRALTPRSKFLITASLIQFVQAIRFDKVVPFPVPMILQYA